MATNVRSFPSAAADDEPPTTLKELRATLAPGQRKIVSTVTAQFEKELIWALPEIQAGVKTSGAQGSFSVTLDVKHAKKGRFKGLLRPRVRRPREATEIDMHIDDDGQLSLGLPPAWSDEGEEGSEAQTGEAGDDSQE